MLNVSASTKIYVAAGPTDMRKSYDTLAALVTNSLGRDPLSGDLFVFCNRARNRLKILVWEPGGFWLVARRLEKGTFAWPDASERSIELTPSELTLLLGGLDLRETRERRWYRRAATAQHRATRRAREA